MQTAPRGTYKGMVDCAGGILRNEGPLAFYKVNIDVSQIRQFAYGINREP